MVERAGVEAKLERIRACLGTHAATRLQTRATTRGHCKPTSAIVCTQHTVHSEVQEAVADTVQALLARLKAADLQQHGKGSVDTGKIASERYRETEERTLFLYLVFGDCCSLEN